MGLHCFPFILLELFMSLNACSWILNGFTLYSFHTFGNIHVLLMHASDIKWAYIVFLSYFWNYSCPLMHAQILNGLTLFSFHTFGNIHVP